MEGIEIAFSIPTIRSNYGGTISLALAHHLQLTPQLTATDLNHTTSLEKLGLRQPHKFSQLIHFISIFFSPLLAMACCWSALQGCR